MCEKGVNSASIQIVNDIEADDGMVYKEEFLMEQEELKKVRIWCERV